MASGSKPPIRAELTLCFCFLLSTPSGICRWFNLFTSTCSHCRVCCSLVVIFKLLFTCFSLSSLSGLLLSKKFHLCVFFLVSIFFFLVFLSKTPLKALAHTHSFPVALFHRRNRDDPRKVCLAAECGFPPLYFILFSGLLLFLSLFNPAFCSLSCCFSLSDQGGFLGQLL